MNIEVRSDWWKTLFDDVYLITDSRSVCDEEVTRREIDMVATLLPLKKTDRILDLCGGQGRHSIELSGRGYVECTVFDFSHALLEHGRKVAERLERPVAFLQGDATHIGLPSEDFDHVLILGNSLGYLPEAEDDLKIICEAWRILKPGGWFLADVTDGAVIRERFTPNAWHEIADNIVVCRQRELDENGIRAREIVLCKKQGLVRDQTYAIRTYGPTDLQRLVGKAGFGEVTIQRGFSAEDRDCGDYGFMNHRLLVIARKA